MPALPQIAKEKRMKEEMRSSLDKQVSPL